MRARLSLAVFLAAAATAGGQPPPTKGVVTLPPLTEAQYADPKAAAATAAEIEKQYADNARPEAVRMLLAVLRGSQMGPGEGWFGPARTRYTWAWLAKQHELDAKAKGVSRAAFRGPADLFARLDRDGDGAVTPADLDWSDKSPYVQQAAMVSRLFRRMDADGNSKISREDFEAFLKRAGGGKDHLTPDDLRAALLSAGPGGGFLPGDGPSIPMLVKGLYGSEVGSLQEGPGVGDLAPDFTLKTVDGTQTVTLSKLVGPKPVVLVFGNFTCGPFRAIFPEADALRERYKDRATFVMVYVREAHPLDGWKMESNTKVGVAVKQPTTTAERVAVCEQFRDRLKPGMPVLVDEIGDPVGNAYSGMPARFYVVDPRGKVAYQSGRGPFGFKAGELEQALAMCLLESAPAPAPTGRRLMTDEEAWAALPKAAAGGSGPVPNWAKAVAAQLPRTAAAMLELDHAQRVTSPLDPQLRAMMRWVVASANRCGYAQATALADLRRAGGDPAVLTGDPARWPEAVRGPLEFARLLTVSAPEVTDAQFETLRRSHGDKGVAAMVLLAAYGNFQDRVLLGLGVPLEAGGPLPPVAVKFAPGTLQAAPVMPPQGSLPKLLDGGRAVVAPDPEWAGLGYDELQARLERQRDRTPRLPVPTWDEVRKGLPADFAARPTRIVWNLVGMGYCPELAVPWTTATRTMWAEAPQDRVFEESLFWVQTRAVRCNYCMGHCEMLLEVAGLDKGAVAERTRRLGGADWSYFPPAEQRAFAYARTLSATPWALTAADYRTLEADLGPRPAMAVFWWLCRGLYMTRVSDGFQLPLERENVFAPAPPKP